MIVNVELKGKKGLVTAGPTIEAIDNLVDALKKFNPKEVKSIAYTEGDVTTFAVPVKTYKGYTLKVTGKYNNKTGNFIDA